MARMRTTLPPTPPDFTVLGRTPCDARHWSSEALPEGLRQLSLYLEPGVDRVTQGCMMALAMGPRFGDNSTCVRVFGGRWVSDVSLGFYQIGTTPYQPQPPRPYSNPQTPQSVPVLTKKKPICTLYQPPPPRPEPKPGHEQVLIPLLYILCSCFGLRLLPVVRPL